MSPPHVTPAQCTSRLPVILSLFAPAPPAAVMLEDPAEIKAQYH